MLSYNEAIECFVFISGVSLLAILIVFILRSYRLRVVLVLPLTLLWTHCPCIRAFRSRDSIVNIYGSITTMFTLSVCALILVKGKLPNKYQWNGPASTSMGRGTPYTYISIACVDDKGWLMAETKFSIT
jgi:hypothetical protein